MREFSDQFVTIREVNEESGLIEEVSLPRYYKDGDGIIRFNTKERFSFPVNSMDDQSTTVFVATCQQGEPVAEGYAAIQEFIREHLGLCPVGVCLSMGFNEVIGL